jgi:hypothetical protein
MMVAVAVVAVGLGAWAVGRSTPAVAQQPAGGAAAAGGAAKERVFEIRTYVAAEGKLEALQARFRDHTTKLFAKHGIEQIGYWTPTDEKKGAGNTLVYLLAYPSKEAAAASWKAFGADPDWKAALKASEVNGKLTAKIESVYLKPTDYSQMK